MKKNIVFIAQSLDGYIADKNGGLAWLELIPNPEQKDIGYSQLIQDIEAIVMGRTTYETVKAFGGDWPYTKPVFVLSRTLNEDDSMKKDNITLLSGEPKDILNKIHKKGYHSLYIDGGTTIQNFMKDGLIDELRITTIPILLGGGFPLFGDLIKPIEFIHIKTEVFLGQMIQSHYHKK